VNSLFKTAWYPTASRLRFKPSPTAPESSTLITRLPSHHAVQEGNRRCVQRFIISYSCLKRSGMARVNEGSHRDHLPLTRLSTSGMSHTCLYCLVAEHHRTLASILVSRPAGDKRLS